MSDDVDNSITRITGFTSGVLQGTITSAKTHARVVAAAVSAVTGYPLVLGARKAANGVGDVMDI